jgi:TRAP-type C4-dicarboxylate transport system permease small subunit
VASVEGGLAPLTPVWPERTRPAGPGLCLGTLCLLITVAVLSRWAGNPLIRDSVLLVRELMVAVIVFPLAAVTALREQIAVTVFTQQLSQRALRPLAVLEHLMGLVFSLGLFLAAWRLLSNSYSSGEYYSGSLELPLWLGHAVFLTGVSAFGLRLLAMLARDLGLLPTGKAPAPH